MDSAEARRQFSQGQVARLATADADGNPHVVPMVFAVEGDVVYSIVDAKPKRSRRLKRLANIAVNPRVSLLVDDYRPDWSAIWWARADGTATVVEHGPLRDRAIQLLRAKYPQYADSSATFGAAIMVSVERWSGWSAVG
jgi:PPOX class probable F420-dependent enzyme